jgi:hypothetical protein
MTSHAVMTMDPFNTECLVHSKLLVFPERDKYVCSGPYGSKVTVAIRSVRDVFKGTWNETQMTSSRQVSDTGLYCSHIITHLSTPP